MIVSRLCLILLFVIGGFSSRSQDKYQPLKCSGPIPSEFRTLIAAKVQKAMSDEAKVERSVTAKKSIVDFISASNRTLDELLTSGKVLFGDSISNYLEKIATVLLKDEPELRKQLRFYAVKSDEENAFTTNNGAILVTIGLMAKFENEAQLAYVLAHEITHFAKQHSVSLVLAKDEIFSGASLSRYNSQEEVISELSSFSREYEMQADNAGFFRFVKAGYDKGSARSMMDILLMSELQLEFELFDHSLLELDLMKFPPRIAFDTTKIKLSDFQGYDDTYSTHPNIEKRRAAIDTLLMDTALPEGNLYIIGANEFIEISKLAKNELIHINLLNQNYVNALYHAQVLLHNNPDSQYVEESIGKALYGLSVNNNHDLVKRGFFNSKGQLQRCFRLFSALSQEQINLIAIRYLLYVERKYNNPFVTRLLNNTIEYGIKYHFISTKKIQDGIEKCNLIVKENLEKYSLTQSGAIPETEDKSEMIYGNTKIFRYKKSSGWLFDENKSKYFIAILR